MPDIQELRIGFIGYGIHARANLYPSILLAGARITSVATRSITSAKAAAAAVGAEHFHDNVESMLDEDQLDAVFISVAPEDQARLTMQCLRAGLAVFVEKPLGMSEQEAREVAELAEASGAKVMVGFMKRFAPAYLKLAELTADKPNFGRITTIDASFRFAPWTEELRDDTYLKYGAIHMVDILRALFGEVEDVQAMRSSQAADIGLVFNLRFTAGYVASLTLCGVPAWSREQERLTVTGTQGWAEVEDLATIRYHSVDKDIANAQRWRQLDSKTTVLRAVNSPMSGGERDLYQRGFAGEVEHFLVQLANGSEPAPSARDNVATMALCDRMLSLVGF